MKPNAGQANLSGLMSLMKMRETTGEVCIHLRRSKGQLRFMISGLT